MITNYDPNISWALHTFELTFMQWDYSLKMTVEVGGNCKGFNLFDGALSTAFDECYDDQDEFGTIVLQRDEDTLEVTLDEIEDLEAICVSIKIVGHVKEARK